ncbi:MAG: hypothetical protein F4003_07770 [Acidimicrobiaceae bacterium]|nr:hypothetical protein [Acidimicrobiaceae bacterium]MYC41162.1 hypothetical protein [Acidimicrobiaceae bacterium]MYH87504.1 hypothetical protein [Acidimicrobiaceae bacterium]
MTSATYRREGELGNWDWDSVSSNTEAFRRWLRNNQHRFEGCKFGNHRKYESLGDQNGFGRTVQTYADWVHRQGTHAAWIEIVRQTTDPFDALYSSMDDVFRFGRLAKFDLLCRLEALDIIDFTPRRAYLQGSTGPLKGTRLLYGHPKGRPLDLDGLLIELESYLNVGFDVLEDALCQWQKQPNGGVSGTCGSPAAPRSCSSAQLSQHC